jgi:alkaline phosphatase D
MRIIYLLLVFACDTLPAASLLQGPMVGHVDDHSARIWCALDERGEVIVRISEDPNLKNAQTITRKDFEMGSISIDGLKADTLYYYQIQAHQYSKSDLSHFKTMGPLGESLKLRFLFSSCSGKTGSDEDVAWSDISKMGDVDLILMLGDNHYADSTNPEVITKHYLSHRSIGGFKRATSRIPTYGIWDDHDYGPNNSDGQTKGKEGSLEIFKAHWANPSYGESGNPGIYFTYVIGDIQFIMLDSRYHRTPNQSLGASDPAKTLLGERQLQWLEEALSQSKAKIKIVSCGSNFELQGSNDGFKGFKVEQRKILDLFERTEGVVLLSGDRHFTAGYHIGGKTIEVTSGPLGSGTVNPKKTPDMFFKETEGKMFSVFEIDTRTNPPRLELEVYRAGTGLIRKVDFSWEQINGLERITQED